VPTLFFRGGGRARNSYNQGATAGGAVGGKIQDAIQRCYSAFGSDLCGDLATVRDYVERALRNVSFWHIHYVVARDRVLVIEETLGGKVRVTAKRLDEFLREYWPLCTQNHPQPIVHGADYWHFDWKTYRVEDLDSFIGTLSALKEWLKAALEGLGTPTKEVRRASIDAIDSRLTMALNLKAEYSLKNRATIRI